MSGAWTILCDIAELAVECAHHASELGLAAEPIVSPDPVAEALKAREAGRSVAVALAEAPDPSRIVRLSGGGHDAPIPLALVGVAEESLAAMARDLGLPAVMEVRPLLGVMALLGAGSPHPWAAATRALSALDRARLTLGAAGSTGKQDTGQWIVTTTGLLGYQPAAGSAVPVGEPRDAAQAATALREAHGASRAPMPRVQGVEPQAVLDVIFGPRRELSDPASKAALAPYDLPMPTEELCTSASRAAAEAARIGFPVRIALASPDLRIGDHPDLAIDGVDNAARVREVFRQLTALGRSRRADARLLGVTVTATTPAHALLWVRVSPLPEDLALCELGFADPHGMAADDRIRTVLPATPSRLEQALSRLQGSGLILQGTAADRRRAVTALGDVLLRLAAFVHDWRAQVESVTLDPLALVVGGGLEVREARVAVGDAFERSLATR
ncbi:MAG: acetate--CoA ligase family protein [Myxococcota bacterium]